MLSPHGASKVPWTVRVQSRRRKQFSDCFNRRGSALEGWFTPAGARRRVLKFVQRVGVTDDDSG